MVGEVEVEAAPIAIVEGRFQLEIRCPKENDDIEGDGGQGGYVSRFILWLVVDIRVG